MCHIMLYTKSKVSYPYLHMFPPPPQQLGPNVYVGAGVNIGPGARVKEAIVLDRAEIQVRDSYVFECLVHKLIISQIYMMYM